MNTYRKPRILSNLSIFEAIIYNNFLHSFPYYVSDHIIRFNLSTCYYYYYHYQYLTFKYINHSLKSFFGGLPSSLFIYKSIAAENAAKPKQPTNAACGPLL